MTRSLTFVAAALLGAAPAIAQTVQAPAYWEPVAPLSRPVALHLSAEVEAVCSGGVRRLVDGAGFEIDVSATHRRVGRNGLATELRVEGSREAGRRDSQWADVVAALRPLDGRVLVVRSAMSTPESMTFEHHLGAEPDRLAHRFHARMIDFADARLEQGRLAPDRPLSHLSTTIRSALGETARITGQVENIQVLGEANGGSGHVVVIDDSIKVDFADGDHEGSAALRAFAAIDVGTGFVREEETYVIVTTKDSTGTALPILEEWSNQSCAIEPVSQFADRKKPGEVRAEPLPVILPPLKIPVYEGLLYPVPANLDLNLHGGFVATCRTEVAVRSTAGNINQAFETTYRLEGTAPVIVEVAYTVQRYESTGSFPLVLPPSDEMVGKTDAYVIKVPKDGEPSFQLPPNTPLMTDNEAAKRLRQIIPELAIITSDSTEVLALLGQLQSAVGEIVLSGAGANDEFDPVRGSRGSLVTSYRYKLEIPSMQSATTDFGGYSVVDVASGIVQHYAEAAEISTSDGERGQYRVERMCNIVRSN